MLSAPCSLRRVLLAICVLAIMVPALAVEVVVDNDGGAPAYAETGSWSTSVSTGYAGGTYRVTNGVAGAPTASATWTPDIPSTGTYRLYAAFRNGSNRTTSASVTVRHTTGTTVAALNQNGAGVVVEVPVGEFLFNAGSAGWARMDNGATAGVLIADAMIWRSVQDPLPAISGIGRDRQAPMQTDSVVVTATVTDNVAITSVSVNYTVTPSGTGGSTPALDDGSHGDGAADDHVFGATIPPQPNGSTVAFSFAATDNLGQLAASPACYYAVGPLGPSIPDVVVDNDGGAPGYVETGGWTTSSSTGYAGGTYRYAAAVTGAPTATATWTAAIPRDGLYSVYAAFLKGANRTPSAPVRVTHAAGISTMSLDQSGGSALVEVLLGEFPFRAGTTASVQMTNNALAGICVADAAIWRLPSDPKACISSVTRSPAVPDASDTVTVTARVTDDAWVTSAALVVTVNPGAASLVIPAHDDGAHGDGAAGDHVYGALIPPQPAGAVVSLHYEAWDNIGQLTAGTAQHYVVGQPPRNVYVVPASDTSVWGFSSGPNPTIPWNVFESRTGVLARLYDPAFRNAHVDSYGQPIRITWFMHGGAWFRAGANSNVVSATHHIRKNWESGIAAWGDTLEYHFHHYVYDAGWVMAPTFAETIWEYEWVMSQMMLEERLFITAFRSGWNYMDNSYQQYLERWVPFRMEGVQSDWVPYHPSPDNWKTAGTMKGWEARHIYTKSLTPSVANAAFLRAQQGRDQVVCVWSHQNEGDFPDQLAAVDSALHAAAALYPAVQFHYLSADEAMRRWLGHAPAGPPPLQVVSSPAGNAVNVLVRTADGIYQEQPWVAARRYAGNCVRLDCRKTAPGEWSFSYPRDEYDQVTVGVSDIDGMEALADVDDGSRRWTAQSEFRRASPWNVDHDTSPSCAMLAMEGGDYTSSGTLTFDHAMTYAGEWRSIVLEGSTPGGSGLRWHYKTADTHELLDSAPWTAYETQRAADLPQGLTGQWIRIEVLLEGAPGVTPILDSVEVTYSDRVTSASPKLWTLY